MLPVPLQRYIGADDPPFKSNPQLTSISFTYYRGQANVFPDKFKFLVAIRGD
jgi:hypothetical protein